MAKTKLVRIGSDIMELLAKHRQSDDETVNQVLRRVLGLKQKPSTKKPVIWSEYEKI